MGSDGRDLSTMINSRVIRIMPFNPCFGQAELTKKVMKVCKGSNVLYRLTYSSSK